MTVIYVTVRYVTVGIIYVYVDTYVRYVTVGIIYVYVDTYVSNRIILYILLSLNNRDKASCE